MTFEDDFVRLNTEAGTKDLNCLKNNIEWPPPEVLDVLGFRYVRVGYSQITDAQRAEMTHVCRGAEYDFVKE